MPVAYNPYLHTSRSPLNDQFSSAWSRPELVTVEVEIPESELSSGYHADKAKNAVGEVDWRRYGLEQRGGKGLPYGPAIILVHVASTKVPFTSEGKEAIATFPEIEEEIVAALKLCARNLKSHLNKMDKKSKTHEKFDIVQGILPDLANKIAEQLGKPVPDLSQTISKIMNVVWIEPVKE
jgi:DNA topoisomerase-6 subunit B